MSLPFIVVIEIIVHVLSCSQDQNCFLHGVEERLTLQGHPKHSATPQRIPTVKLIHHQYSNLYSKHVLALTTA